MSFDKLLFEPASPAMVGGMSGICNAPPPTLQRSRGVARLAVRRHPDGTTRLADLHQEGASKIRLPRVDGPLTAVVINTAGGVTDGDRFVLDVDVGDGADAVVTTQACEKVYRAAGHQPAAFATTIRIGDGACCAWLPQETILFDGGRVDRRLEVDLAGTASLVALEAYVLGRTAMGETVGHGSLRERWRVHREGRLVHADVLTIDGAFARAETGAALLAGARAFATLVAIGPDAEAGLAPLRAVIGDAGGASAFDGKLVARIACRDSLDLRLRLVEAVAALGDGPAPSLWHI